MAPVNRTLKSFNHWLAPSLGAPLHLDYDVDRIEALAGERGQEWARIGAAAFLSDDEKRKAVGYWKAAAVAKFGLVSCQPVAQTIIGGSDENTRRLSTPRQMVRS